jgi:hypothetical protein
MGASETPSCARKVGEADIADRGTDNGGTQEFGPPRMYGKRPGPPAVIVVDVSER